MNFLLNCEPILVYFQVILGLYGVFVVRKTSQLLIKSFSYLYLVSTLVQCLCYVVQQCINVEANYIFYNVLFVITFLFLFLFYIYYKHIKNDLIKFVIIGFAIVYGILIFVELLLLKLNYFEQTQVISYIFAATCVIILILIYFYYILKSNEVIEIHNRMIFWISVAYFLYYLFFIPVKLDQHYLSSLIESKNTIILLRILSAIVLNIVLTIGFIWQHRTAQEQ